MKEINSGKETLNFNLMHYNCTQNNRIFIRVTQIKISERKETLDGELYWHPIFYKNIRLFIGIKKTLRTIIIC